MRILQKTIIESIISGTCYYFEVNPEDIKSRSRKTVHKEPRQIIIAMCYCFTTNSLADIAWYIANRDHATAIHSLKKVIDHYDCEVEYAQLVRKILAYVNFDLKTNFTFDDIRNYRSKKWKELAKKGTKTDIMQEIFEKGEEVALALTDEQKLEKANELKAIYNRLNHIKNAEFIHAQQQKENQQTMGA